MKNAKKIGITIAVIAALIGLFCLYWFLTGWPVLYRSRLNNFFGEGNWKVISEEAKKDRKDYTMHYNIFGEESGSKKEVGIYREWYILYENEAGEEEIWKLSTHAYEYNHKKYGIFNSSRYKRRQAFTLELMEISFNIIEEDVHKDIVSKGLSKEEADCIYVDMFYRGGNPPADFYDELAEQEWFNVDGITAENYLATDLYDFYLHIGVHEYKMDKLSEEEQENVEDSLEDIEERLLEEFGDNASFEIYYNGFDVEYVDGEKQ